MEHGMMAVAMGENPYGTKAPDVVIDYIDYLMREMKSNAVNGDLYHFKKCHKLVIDVLNEITHDDQKFNDEWSEDVYDAFYEHASETLHWNDEAIKAWLDKPYSDAFKA